MNKLILPILTFFLLASGLSAQDEGKDAAAKEGEKDKSIIFDHEFSIGGGLHTRGFNIVFTSAKIPKYYLTRFWQLELGEIKHPKEYKQNFDRLPGLSSPKAFIFGKQNNFYFARVGYGEKRYLSDKGRKKGLAVGINYTFGATLGLLKPYYLDLLYPNNDHRSEKYSPENASHFLNPSYIEGASGIGKGWDGLRPLPGGYAKAGLLFDWGAFDEILKCLEVGVMLDVFYKKVPIMVTQQNRPFFINLYLNIHFGKRW